MDLRGCVFVFLSFFHKGLVDRQLVRWRFCLRESLKIS
jgi:hypothetical protein